MTIETEVVALTSRVNAFVTAVNTQKPQLDSAAAAANANAVSTASDLNSVDVLSMAAYKNTALANALASVTGIANEQTLIPSFASSGNYLASASQTLHYYSGTIAKSCIYDTSKDSDGGAWRDRCFDLSWENEALAAKWLGRHSSETYARNVGATLGPELVANGDFSSAVGWGTSDDVGTALTTISGGVATLASVSGVARLAQTVAFVIGKTYLIQWGQTGAGLPVYTGSSENFGTVAVGQNARIFVATANSNQIGFRNFAAGTTAVIDNLSIKEIVSQNTVIGDYYQSTADGKFYKLNSVSGVTEIFRGSKRKFPQIVSIVVESARVIIYDLTQTNCPMWMVFLAASSGSWLVSKALFGTSLSCAAAINGELLIGQSIADGGITRINLVSDSVVKIIASPNYGGRWGGNIASRNSSLSYKSGQLTGYGQIVSNVVNDIAVIVLPDAPINSITGLQVSTVAVATLGGVSIVKNDGLIINDTTSYASVICRSIGFTKDGRLIRNWNDTAHRFGIYSGASKVPTASFSTAGSYDLYFSAAANGTSTGNPITAAGLFQNVSGDICAGGNAGGILRLNHNPSDKTKSMLAVVADTYSSGWQVGDSRGAWLSDTVAEMISSPELVISGSAVTAYSYDNTTVAAGFGFTTSGGTTAIRSSVDIKTVPGRTYSVSFVRGAFTTENPSVYCREGALGQGATIMTIGTNSSGLFVATTAMSSILWVVSNFANSPFTITDISVKMVDADRSVKTGGLLVAGNVSKTPVATSAQLVAYGGNFSNKNYLYKPYNSNFDFGTGDFSIAGWVELTNDGTILFKGQDMTVVNAPNGINIWTYWSNSSIKMFIGGAYLESTNIKCVSGFNNFVIQRVSGILSIYINGIFSNSVGMTGSLTGVGHTLTVGAGFYNNPSVRIALLRVSATAFSPDQIAKVYRDESPLFRKGAKCTLAGNSTNITALAGDSSTNLLHAYTPWGRSAFKGLLRADSEVNRNGSTYNLSAENGTIVAAGASASIFSPASNLRGALLEGVDRAKSPNDSPVFFDFDATAGQTAFAIPKGFATKAVFCAGASKRNGATKDYTVSSDGFQETVTFNTAPGNGVWVSVRATRN